jgi:hypothetical protein
VLSNNNIILETAPMRRFPPMRHIEISGFYYDVPALLEIFFEDTAQVIQIETDESDYAFRHENHRMDISNGFIFFDNFYGIGENDRNAGSVSREEAISVADQFISAHFSDFVRDIVFDEFGGNGIHVRYLQQYRGHLIYSNAIEFLVTADGISWVEMQFGRVIGYGPEPRMIFAPDEVLLTFMQRVHYRARDNPMYILSMEIVYLKEYASNAEGQVYPAVPFYRIFVQDRDIPFMINAYTNVILE